MYAVIFQAQINQLDHTYTTTAARMRELATSQYGCVEFTSVTEGDKEISISYWQSLEQIQKWKQDEEHIQAQAMGRAKWYKNYNVQIVEVMRTYSSTPVS